MMRRCTRLFGNIFHQSATINDLEGLLQTLLLCSALLLSVGQRRKMKILKY